MSVHASRGWRLLAVFAAVVACSRIPGPVISSAPTAEPDAGADAAPLVDAAAADASITDASVVDAIAVRPPPPHWLKGSTHVHAAPSGDSGTDVASVIAWYESHGYDFIVLTDHNRVTKIDPAAPPGGPAVRIPDKGLVVLAGIELTYNPGVCDPPPPEPGGKCRIHVSGLGVTARPDGRIEWADRKATTRAAMYRAARRWIDAAGGVVQLNHPQWHWGMTPEVLSLLAGEGVHLVEIANAQFTRWNAGDAKRPSMEALWDAVLTAGGTMWGVASDDAHDYAADGSGKYPAGGGWIMVDAPRDPVAIVKAIDEGHFYASTGVSLLRADVWNGALSIDVDSTTPHTIRFIGSGGRVLSEVRGTSATFPLAGVSGYVRVVVERADGAKAWVQPVRPASRPL